LIIFFALMLAPMADDKAASSAPSQHEQRPVRVERDVELAQITIEQRVIIRIPMARPGGAGPGMPMRPDRQYRAPPPPVEWDEEKGPKCVSIRAVRAAAVTSSQGVDLMMRDNSRLRARLSRECRSADLWAGFYIQPNPDGELCAGRDEVLARGGASCQIEKFRKLVPEKP
jgi:hypothetical protein